MRQSLARIQWVPYEGGHRLFSVPDVVGNVGLFVPFGLLLGLAARGVAGPVATLALVTLAALALSVLVEAAQLFVPGRTPSPGDVLAHLVGAFSGGMAARWLARHDHDLDGAVRRLVHREPLLVPLALLGLALAADRWYPFEATLDVSTAWGHLKHAQWAPFASLQTPGAIDRVATQLVWPALLGALVHHALLPSRLLACVASTMFLAALETGKLVFAGRHPNVDNVLLGLIGALGGILVVPVLVRTWPVRRWPSAALVVLAAALLVHAQLSPFDLSLSGAHLLARAAQTEWLPFASYHGTDIHHALFDLANKLLLSGFLGFALARALPRVAGAATAGGLLAGAVLEAAQIATAARVPSVTDVIALGIGALIGGAAHQRYRALRPGARRLENRPHDPLPAYNEP